MDIIKVKANSRTAAVAGAIAGVMREHKHAEVQAIGAGAVNQAVKALVLAKGYLAEDGMTVTFSAEFVDVNIEDKVRTAIKLIVDVKGPIIPPPEGQGHVSRHITGSTPPSSPLMIQTPTEPETPPESPVEPPSESQSEPTETPTM